jgi:hypothetical protein
MLYVQWIHLSSRVKLEPRRRWLVPLVEIEARRSRGSGKGRKTQVVKTDLPSQWLASCTL